MDPTPKAAAADEQPRSFQPRSEPNNKAKDDPWADNIHLTPNEHSAQLLRSHNDLLTGKFIEFITHAENQKR